MRLMNIATFLKYESAGGVILFVTALAAFIVCNSPWAHHYHALWQMSLKIPMANEALSKPLLFWVNEGLMTLFFLVIGLELKRECVQGELASLSKVALPAVAALGGMIIPAIVFFFINMHRPEVLVAWATPVATDIAFALGVLSLFGKRVPIGLKLFLMALAIFDDIGAILIIAIFHTQSLSALAFVLAAVILALLALSNVLGVRHLWPYLVLGLLLWLSVLESGVHATLAGVLLALLIPLRSGTWVKSPLLRLETHLQPWVAYGVMPLFAFANAGLTLEGLSHSVLADSLVLGLVLGLFLGKQIGVFGFSCLMIRLGWAKLPEQTSWLAFYAVAVLCGIGFTMSLFLGTLAFPNAGSLYLTEVRLGVLLGSLLSGVLAAMLLQFALAKSLHKGVGVG